MESVTSINLHRFGDGVLVELVGTGLDGDVAVRSFEFELVDPGGNRIRPRSTLPGTTSVLIEDRVNAAGYELAPEAEPSPA